MHTGFTIVLYVAIAALVFYRVVWRQLRGTLLTPKRLVALPALMIVLGVYLAWDSLQSLSTDALLMLGADIVLLAGMGVLRSSTSTLSEREGTTFVKGTPLTMVLWAATVGVRIAFSFLSGAFGVDHAAASSTILVTLGVSIAAQNAFTYYRIQKRGLPLTDQPATRVSAGR